VEASRCIALTSPGVRRSGSALVDALAPLPQRTRTLHATSFCPSLVRGALRPFAKAHDLPWPPRPPFYGQAGAFGGNARLPNPADPNENPGCFGPIAMARRPQPERQACVFAEN